MRSTSRSAGYDFFSPEDIRIPPGKEVLIRTGVKVYMKADEALFIYPRSSLGIKKGLMLKNTVGIIDSDYYNNPENEGEIMLCLLNISEKEAEISSGDKICQGIFQKILVADEDVQDVERLGGIGSTGR